MLNAARGFFIVAHLFHVMLLSYQMISDLIDHFVHLHIVHFLNRQENVNPSMVNVVVLCMMSSSIYIGEEKNIRLFSKYCYSFAIIRSTVCYSEMIHFSAAFRLSSAPWALQPFVLPSPFLIFLKFLDTIQISPLWSNYISFLYLNFQSGKLYRISIYLSIYLSM